MTTDIPDFLRLDDEPSPRAVKRNHVTVDGKRREAGVDSIERRFGVTPEKVLPVIFKNRGLLSHTAKHFKMPASTMARYVKSVDKLAEAMHDAREAMGDEAEKKLFNLIREGDVRCILYYLSTVHRGRGYGLRTSDDPFHDATRPVYVETVNVVAVPSGTFLPANKPVVIDN
jgi:hypothetical protein